MLEPKTCFVVDDDTGRGVGYFLGVVKTPAFVQKYKEQYITYLEAQGFSRPSSDEDKQWATNLPNALREIMFNPEGMLHREWPKLIEEYPAHMHIDILPSHQGQGWGRKLIEQFCTLAKAAGAGGLHLGMAATNDEAGKFYSKLGFSRFPQVLDGGASGEEGRDGGTIWLVKKL
jgi:GNAT superfamily N-acetyltransferase